MSNEVRTFPLRRIYEHGPGVKSFYFDRLFDVRAGQFINLWLPGVDEKPFSVSNLTAEEMEISIKAYGPFSKAIMDVSPVAYLGVRGPFGNGFSLHNNALLIGGGIGIAPLRLLARELKDAGMRFATLLGAMTAHEIIFAEDFNNSAPTYLTTDDGSLGVKGRVTNLLKEVIEKERIEYIYAAGPEIMIVKVKELIDPLGIPYEFSMERYMKCGIGICGQCCLDGSGIRLCVEGPVLNNAELKQITELGKPHRDASGLRKVQ
jgi:dihydroorotate dehydrogenase electron transfer subunit